MEQAPTGEADLSTVLTELGVEASSVGRGPLRSGVVQRPILTDRLVKAIESPLVVLAAPAGCGKTIAVKLWAEADPRPFAWAQLGPPDDDPVYLLRHIAAAIHTCSPLDPEVVRVLVGPGRPLDTALLPTLGRAVAARSPMAIVLDDAHLATSDGALEVIQELLRYLPVGSQLVLISRQPPQLQLARRRLEGGLAEIDAEDLTMDADEARKVISVAGLRLSESETDGLINHTEGWPAGLGLSVLALRESGRIRTGSPDTGRSIAGYLMDEVLSGAEKDTVDFLLRSSVLERMNGPLLDEVLGGTSAADLLDRIDRSRNLFLVALDDRHEGFRFPHLVGDALRTRLQSERPLEARTLRSRASRALEERGDIDGAIRQAAAAGESGRAAELILGHSLKLINDGRVALLGQWIELVGPDLAERNPSLALARAWYGAGTADPTMIARSIKAAESLVHDGPLADGSPSLDVAIAAIRSLIAAEGTVGVLRDTATIRAGGGPRTNPWWGYATCLAGTVASLDGDNTVARDLMYAGVGEVAHSPSFEAAFLGVLALIEADDQDFDQARRRARRAMKLCGDHNLEGVSWVIPAYAAEALMAALDGRAEESRTAALRCRRLMAELGDLSARSALRGYLALAQAALALGDRQGARAMAHEAALARRLDPTCSYLNVKLDSLMTVLGGADVSQRDPVSISTAELRVLAYLPTHLSLGDIAARVFVSRNTVKSHVAAIYRKLGVVSRAEAVAAADRLGLLGVAGPVPQTLADAQQKMADNAT
ncbi:MAG: hypothetical protein IPF42_12075 [Candidatus Microthrix sp.]|nr:hypothetical protein [Candidatus Microthrix sp.]